ncbi:hypothetical protein NP233_g7189 [Leucocoprinus birnbaumii]|uniref:CCHC-type domain-containing protein n=1 Tax=Leucocoprinus birnbaumii TaxID=56174 RepID=A0AAD5VPS6_9AGAR|nr:hypothetical protein NP233_g7189 [Leucocoprinus birnbaumii]
MSTPVRSYSQAIIAPTPSLPSNVFQTHATSQPSVSFTQSAAPSVQSPFGSGHPDGGQSSEIEITGANLSEQAVKETLGSLNPAQLTLVLQHMAGSIRDILAKSPAIPLYIPGISGEVRKPATPNPTEERETQSSASSRSSTPKRFEQRRAPTPYERPSAPTPTISRVQTLAQTAGPTQDPRRSQQSSNRGRTPTTNPNVLGRIVRDPTLRRKAEWTLASEVQKGHWRDFCISYESYIDALDQAELHKGLAQESERAIRSQNPHFLEWFIIDQRLNQYPYTEPIRRDSGPLGRPERSSNPPRVRLTGHSGTPPPFFKCNHCGNPGHYPLNCPEYTCPICLSRQPGHYSYSCPQYICPRCHTIDPQHRAQKCPNPYRSSEPWRNPNRVWTNTSQKQKQRVNKIVDDRSVSDLEPYEFDDEATANITGEPHA